MVSPDPYRRYRPWFYAAAIYNLAWGAVVSLFPNALFRLAGMEPSNYPALVQCLGMVVGVYAPAYYLVARDPARYGPFIWIGLLGKTLGPVGFLVSALRGDLPWAFGVTILTNDLIWWPVFWRFSLRIAREPRPF